MSATFDPTWVANRVTRPLIAADATIRWVDELSSGPFGTDLGGAWFALPRRTPPPVAANATAGALSRSRPPGPVDSAAAGAKTR